jgi:hypothetical protein
MKIAGLLFATKMASLVVALYLAPKLGVAPWLTIGSDAARSASSGFGSWSVDLFGVGPAHQSWTPMTILSDPLGRLERFGADVAE